MHFSSFVHSVFIYSRNINLKIYKNEEIVNRNKTDQIRAKKNDLSWLDNDFVLTVIKTAYVTFAFTSKPCCNIFLKFNIKVFYYVLW